jgi:hypothetical protein
MWISALAQFTPRLPSDSLLQSIFSEVKLSPAPGDPRTREQGFFVCMENTESKLSQLEIVRAATNDPAMSERVVVLGDREFPVVDLDYSSYCRFLAKLQPLLQAVAGRLGVTRGLVQANDFGLNTLIDYCAYDLPEMAHIVVSQTDPDITVEDVKKLGKTPFKLANIVLAQIEQNEMITEIANFFVQMLPLLSEGRKLMMDEETPSSSSTSSAKRTTGRTKKR